MTPQHTSFEQDPYPGKPKILFISRGFSSHTIDWINLLQDAPFNVRLYSQPHYAPPDDWPFRAYITGLGYCADVPESNTRKRLRPMQKGTPSLATRAINRVRRQLKLAPPAPPSPERWLIDIIEQWQPNMIQTLSLGSSQFFYDACQQANYTYRGIWMAMIWGAPDIILQKEHPVDGPRIAELLQAADYIFSDTEECMDAARELGVQTNQIPQYYIFPGAGGVDVDALVADWQDQPPSQRRKILWPKTYNNYYTSAMATIEGIRLAWDEIQPCELIIPAMQADAEQWFYTLPKAIQDATIRPAHMPHSEFQKLVMQTRVMLSPSLLDGMPNVLVDALACGAFPIVSPLGGLTPILEDGVNTLFARNLYPEEIAQALIRAMNDDALVDEAAQRNIEVAKRIADREEIRRQVIHIYQQAVEKDKS